MRQYSGDIPLPAITGKGWPWMKNSFLQSGYQRVLPYWCTVHRSVQRGYHWPVGSERATLVAFRIEVSQKINNILYRSWNGIVTLFSTPADPLLAERIIWLGWFLSPRRQEEICSFSWNFLVCVVLPEICHMARGSGRSPFHTCTITSTGEEILSGTETRRLSSLGYHGWDGHIGATRTSSTSCSCSSTFDRTQPTRFHGSSHRLSALSSLGGRHLWLSPEDLASSWNIVGAERKDKMRTDLCHSLGSEPGSSGIQPPVGAIPHHPWLCVCFDVLLSGEVLSWDQDPSL